eukprot:TRINITY_DN510_c0_g1::TRINITY_DN510_c0_g1_i1::g.10476::m.10476 TRINITY_DN510_c0_g1::TRINITY_DN510_c0_g1_i1::g.10476  ORF type:complete len:190 (+),score=19.23,sp/Q9ZPY1/PPOX2_ARATH/34.92/6e-10,Pyridox_oxase_2/PF12766.2/4.4e-10,Pyridox_oxase_2/PF12766.2/1.4e+04 TRINITY_DN510_c0_g1_i1:236-805(+)
MENLRIELSVFGMSFLCWMHSCLIPSYSAFPSCSGLSLIAQRPALVFVTDQRSGKVNQLDKGGEICWYFKDTREQFRLACDLELVDHQTPESDDIKQELRQHVWKNVLSPQTRSTYLPSQNSALDTETPVIPFEKSPSSGGSVDIPPPSPNMILLLALPYNVDHLILQQDGPNIDNVYSYDRLNRIWST